MTHPRTPPASEALALFRHSRIGPIFLAIFAAVLAGASGFVLYLSTILPASTRHAAAPIRYSHVNLVTPDNLSLHHGSSAFMAILALIVLLQCYMVIRRRKSRFELHEDGVVHQIGETRTYAPFAAIQDVYLFASGQTALAGLINNFAYRTTPEQNWVLVSGELRGFDDFVDEFRKRHVAHRLPILEQQIADGHRATFRYIRTTDFYIKRWTGRFLALKTQELALSNEGLHVDGVTWPLSTLKRVELSFKRVELGKWTERLTIQDLGGRTAFSCMGTGILSFDVFIDLVCEQIDQTQAHT